VSDGGTGAGGVETHECPKCGKPLAAKAAFCRSCGAKYELPAESVAIEAAPVEDAELAAPACAKCGAGLAPNAAFCRGCGTPVAAEPPTRKLERPAPPTPPSPPPKLTRPAPAPGPAPAPAGGKRSRWPFVVAALVLVIGAGAAAAIVLGGSSGTDQTTVAVDPAPEAAEANFGEDEELEEAGLEQEGEEAEAEETTAAGFPAVSPEQMEEEVATLLRDYHEDVVAEDFQSAWALLSARKRQQDLDEYGYRKWASAQASLNPYLHPGALEASLVDPEGEGVVRVDVTGMEWDKAGAPCSEWSGLTWAKYEHGEWTYDPGYSTTSARRATWQPRSGQLLGADCAE
jgi:ribosomal protein L40E